MIGNHLMTLHRSTLNTIIDWLVERREVLIAQLSNTTPESVEFVRGQLREVNDLIYDVKLAVEEKEKKDG